MDPHPFILDSFQLEATVAIDAGVHVLVAAPTGAGKTVVAEHAVTAALAAGQRAFYTTPIKALSNQKFRDLSALHGSGQVGLLTGDNVINADAPVVVMTTEVLRNMIYARSRTLDQVGWVVLDEVHYLQDTYRGPVWEEVLIQAPDHIRFVCLSATVSNAEELAAWIEAVRGDTRTVIEHKRPVELINHFAVHDRVSGEIVQLRTLVDGRPNVDGHGFDKTSGGRRRGPRRGSGPGERQRWGTPRRPEVAAHLSRSRLLPAIYFIFSRAGCDEAVRSVIDSGLSLTSAEERAEIRALVEHHTAALSPEDLVVLGRDRWLAALESGVAAHHAGMVPAFKEAVEACFVRGLVKVVFATETLALGINMPARSVVIESLSKFTGETHEDLTPAQYTQLTGRAGRRGLDPVGHALVLWSPWYGFDKVAALAASREYVLRSAFRPTFNMAINLVLQHDRDGAHDLLGRSFAQFQTDRGLGRLVNRRTRLIDQLESARRQATCELGDVAEYRRLRKEERAAVRRARRARAHEIEAAMAALRPGDVIEVSGAALAVVSSSHRRGSVEVRAVDRNGLLETYEPEDLDEAPTPIARVDLPVPFIPRERASQRHLANNLRRAATRGRDPKGRSRPVPAGSSEPTSADHPVATCPDLDEHLRATAEADRLESRLAETDRRMGERSGSLARQFDLLVTLLQRRRFLDGWELTERGEVLSQIFHESDLLCAAAISDGLFDDLEPPEMAGLVSMLTYEHRSKEPPSDPWYPTPAVEERARRLARLARDLADEQTDVGLVPRPAPDPTFLAQAHAWAAGWPFEDVMEEESPLSPGDFVRNVRTLIDLLGQIGDVAPTPATARSARAAASALRRGVVAAGSEPTRVLDPEAGSGIEGS